MSWFGCAPNLRYHEDRQCHYERLQRWANFASVALGSAGLASLLAGSSRWTGGAALATTLVGAAQLVFDFSTHARLEADLKKESAKLLSAVDRNDFDPRAAEADLSTMYGTELETYHAVNALAYNAAQLAFGRPTSTLLKVTGWQKWLRHFRTYEPSDFPDRQTAGT